MTGSSRSWLEQTQQSGRKTTNSIATDNASIVVSLDKPVFQIKGKYMMAKQQNT
ncbi:FMN-dependent monooxygenase [Sesbania bispinosa]|nr:FMN-dependent monooxygenase [Sesbania bispinosa]